MKTKQSKLIITTASLLTLGLLATAVLRAEPEGPRPSVPGSVGPLMERGRPVLGAIARAFHEADIDVGQRQQVKAVLKKYYPTVNPLVDKLIVEHKKLREVTKASPVDEAGIRAQSAAVAAVQADLAVQRAYIGAEIRAILRPEQLEKFKDLEGELVPIFQEHRARIGEWLMNS
jgi:periplasmic protein CpxP/Spy